MRTLNKKIEPLIGYWQNERSVHRRSRTWVTVIKYKERLQKNYCCVSRNRLIKLKLSKHEKMWFIIFVCLFTIHYKLQ